MKISVSTVVRFIYLGYCQVPSNARFSKLCLPALFNSLDRSRVWVTLRSVSSAAGLWACPLSNVALLMAGRLQVMVAFESPVVLSVATNILCTILTSMYNIPPWQDDDEAASYLVIHGGKLQL